MLEWSEKFEIGDPLIDAQHRMLISYVNRLDSLAETTNPTPEEVALFFRFIEFLESYVLTHFKHEEECMFRARCPVHLENKRAHGEFLDFFQQFKRQVAVEGWRPDSVRELRQSCNLWIQKHIMRIDMQLKKPRDPGGQPDPA